MKVDTNVHDLKEILFLLDLPTDVDYDKLVEVQPMKGDLLPDEYRGCEHIHKMARYYIL